MKQANASSLRWKVAEAAPRLSLKEANAWPRSQTPGPYQGLQGVWARSSTPGSTPPACVSGWTWPSSNAAGSATATRSIRPSTAATCCSPSAPRWTRCSTGSSTAPRWTMKWQSTPPPSAVRFAREQGLLVAARGGGHVVGAGAVEDLVFAELHRWRAGGSSPKPRPLARLQAGDDLETPPTSPRRDDHGLAQRAGRRRAS